MRSHLRPHRHRTPRVHFPELVGPIVPGQHVLVFRDALGDLAVADDSIHDEVFDHFAAIAAEAGHWGEDAATHVPLLLFLEGDAQLELLDESDMFDAGWVRRADGDT